MYQQIKPTQLTEGTTAFLQPQDPRIYNATNGALEPQYTTSVNPTEAWVWIASQDCEGADKTSCRLNINQAIGIGVRRINVKGATMLTDSPNVNPRNQTVRFFSSNSGLFHTVVVPTGFYATSATLMTALTTALNTATGASGLTFSAVAVPLMPEMYDINSAGGAYYFDSACDAITKGLQLWSLPSGTTTATTTKRTGTIYRIYTQYVDIISRDITKNAKMRSITSNQRTSLVVRAYLIGQQAPGEITFYSLPDNLAFAHRFQDPIHEIDFEFRDQNGDLLYVNNPSKLIWQLTIGFEA